MGGGILPVALHDGELHFLLGLEQTKRGGWSDFGGAREGRESPRQTAIREGAEELDGFLGVGNALSERIRENHLLTARSRSYSSYLFQIPYDPYLPTYFAGHRALVKKRLPQHIGKKGLFEKSKIEWFSVKELRKTWPTLRPWYRNIAATILQSIPRIRGRMV